MSKQVGLLIGESQHNQNQCLYNLIAECASYVLFPCLKTILFCYVVK